MKGRDHFSARDAAEIRRLLALLRRAEPGSPQKRLRGQLRALGFYISDWSGSSDGFTRSGFDSLVARGLVKLDHESPRLPAPPRAGALDAPTRRMRAGHKPRPLAAATGGPGAQAVEALAEAPMTIAAAFEGGVPNAAGLYAIYGSAATWGELGLGSPPDARPLYVGKAEASLRSRDLSTHFATGRTGQSSPRRSFAALLAASRILDLQPIPRRRDNPEPRKWTHYALEPADDARLTAWMHNHLGIAVWAAPREATLSRAEREAMTHWQPPLNLVGVSTPWTAQVKEARAAMAERARDWARERGISA